MTTRPRPAYFPVLPAEQALLERMRRADLQRVGLADVLTMLDLLAEAGVGPAELERALELHRTREQEDGLEARFENLEARLRGDIERRMSEMEGRLSKRLAGGNEEASGVNGDGGRDGGQPVESQEVQPDSVVAFRVGDRILQGAAVADFYRTFWTWLVDAGLVGMADLPLRSGRKRFVAAAEPVHASGRAFIKSFEHGGVFVEMNQSRESAVRAASKVLTMVGVDHEVLIGGERKG